MMVGLALAAPAPPAPEPAAVKGAAEPPGPPGEPGSGGRGRSDHPKFSARARRLAAAGRAGRQPPREQNAEAGLPASGPGTLLRDEAERPLFYVRVLDTSPETLRALTDRGGRILHVDERHRQVTVSVAQDRLEALAEPGSVEFVMEAIAPERPGAGLAGGGGGGGGGGGMLAQTACNSPVSEGDAQLRAAAARSTFGVAGAGITVGVLSDSYDRWAAASTRAAGDVATGNLPGPGNPCGRPNPVAVLDDSASGNDEGRAMLQIVHDLAPASNLQFATAFTGMFAFAANIDALADAGSKVIVDDVVYFAEPFFQDGPVAVAVSAARAAGVTYLSAAGNQNLVDAGRAFNGYEAPAFRPTACPPVIPTAEGTCHNFRATGTADPTYRFTLAAGRAVRIAFQWAEPWNGVASDLDAYLLEGSTLRAAGVDNNVTSGVPFEFLSYQNNTASPKILDLVVGRFSGSTPRLKAILFTDTGAVTAVEYGLPAAPDGVTGSTFGHSASADALSLAAAPYFDDTTPEVFSSHGPVTIRFGPVEGTGPAAPLAPPEVRAKPDVTATDGGLTTFFFPPTNRFFGTSAAAPHAAAVAALMLSRMPSLTPGAVAETMRSTARSMAGGTPVSVGRGLVDALAAVGALGVPPPGFNGRVDAVRGVGAADTYQLLERLGDIYNASRGCTVDPRNFSVCAGAAP